MMSFNSMFRVPTLVHHCDWLVLADVITSLHMVVSREHKKKVCVGCGGLFLFHSPTLVRKLTLEAEYLLLGKRYPSELRANGDDGLTRENRDLGPFL